jgi:hypothetical protein
VEGLGYWVVEGPLSKTAAEKKGKLMRREPFFVMDSSGGKDGGEIDRISTLLGGRGLINPDKVDTNGIPVKSRLFVRPNSKAKFGDVDYMRGEVIGFKNGGADPVRLLSAFFEQTEGWVKLTRSLGSFRYLAANNLLMMDTPEKIVSAYIGHLVAALDDRAGDRRLKDYGYSLGKNMHDIMRVLIIVGSNYETTWEETIALLDPDMVTMMIDMLPIQLTSTLIDERAKQDNIVLKAQSGMLASMGAVPFSLRPRAVAIPLAVAMPLADAPADARAGADTPPGTGAVGSAGATAAVPGAGMPPPSKFGAVPEMLYRMAGSQEVFYGIPHGDFKVIGHCYLGKPAVFY